MRTRPTAAAVCSLVVLSLSLLVGCGEEEGPDPEADRTPTSSTSASTSAPASPSSEASPTDGASTSTTMTTKGLGQGSPPGVDVLVAADPATPGGWSLVRSSGERILLNVGQPLEFASLGTGLVVLEDDGEETTAVVLDGAGRERRREEARGYRLAVTADGSVVAWLARAQTTTVLGDDGTTLRLPKVPQAGEIGAVRGGDNCPDVDADGYGCTAYLNGEQAAEVYLTDSHGMTAPLGDPLIRIEDAAADGRLVGLTSVDDLGSCSAVVGDDPDTSGRPVTTR